MNNIFFTADSHFGHDRIIQYCSRPFTNHEEMDEVIIQRFNEVIKSGDRLYHLGDLCWSSFDYKKNFFDRLNTKQVFLIEGNHDIKRKYSHSSLQWVKQLEHLTVDNQQFVLCHYPMWSWRGRGHGAIHLFGHVHGKYFGPEGRLMDVGVDTNNFYPYELSEVKERMLKIPLNSTD